MKAILWTKFGKAEVLEYGEVEKPIPRPDELLIKVEAFTVNRTDCAMLKSSIWIMRLQTGLFKPNQPVLGTDFAGVVEEVGEDVSDYKIGDRIFGFDDTGIQSHAEFMTIKSDNAIAKIPDNISFEDATASIEGPHYARNFINKVNIKSEQKVLVHGATGGIGSGAVQLCKNLGTYVAATCRPEHSEVVKSLGADEVVDYTNGDFTQIDGEFDFVFDAVGKSTFGQCKKLLKPKGVYISSELGPGAQNPFLALITPLLGGKKVKFPFPFDRQYSVNMMRDLLSTGKYKPLIDRTYSFDDTSKAFEYVLQGQKVGNVVVKVN